MSQTNIKVIDKKYLVPFIVVTSLFALWGMANDLTNPMVAAFKKVMPELSNVQASMVQFAFYFGYFVMALPAALFIRRFSYKSGIIVGLILYTIGAFMFYPAAKYEEYNYFLISLYVITCGLSFLETTANPLMLALGDPKTATQRLNLAQAFNPMGSLTGMFIAKFAVINYLQSKAYTKEEYAALPNADAIRTHDLGVISGPYIGVGVLVLVVLIVVLVSKIPEGEKVEAMSISESFKKLFTNKSYLHGVVAQAFNVGAQIMCWTYIFQYVEHMNASRPSDDQLEATWFNMTAMIIFLSCRWIGTALMGKKSPSKMLQLFATGGAVFALGAIVLPGMIGLVSLVCISACLSIVFPTIYGIALKDMGDEAKIGSAGLIMAIVGGALMPPLQGSMLDMGGDGLADLKILGFIPEINFSFILPMICFIVVAHYGYVSYKKSQNEAV